MDRFIEAALMLSAAALTAWALVQNDHYRIGKLEDEFKAHIAKHEIRDKEIDLKLDSIQSSQIRIETKLEALKK